jgi:hypothetical protein
MALPTTSSARSDCTFANGSPGPGGTVVIYGTPVNGDPGADNALVGVCVDTNLPAADGGYAELGLGYAVIDGSDANPAGYAQAYAGLNAGGVSDTNKDTNCDGVDSGGDHNSGGCFWIKPAPASVNALLQNPVTAMFMCGSISGPDWGAAGRDGCSIPDGDICCSIPADSLDSPNERARTSR